VAGEPVSADGAAPELRATSRRIAARLAAMDGAELRDAVLAGAGGSQPVTARPSTSSGRADSHPPLGLPVRQAQGRSELARPTPARPSTGSGRADGQPATVARAAAAVMVQEAPAPSAAPGLEAAILSEVRIALRGVAPADLAAAVGAAPDAVAAALETLRARGTLVQRGSRWFTA